jgi:hypothetical protein
LRPHLIGVTCVLLVLPAQWSLAQAPTTRPAGATESDLKSRIEELERQVKALQSKQEEDELRRLRQEAETAAVAPEAEVPKERTFTEGSRSLQMLNPELTLSGDFMATVIAREGLYASEHDRSGLFIRALGLHFQSTLDPFSITKAALHIEPDSGIHLEEAYITWMGLLPRVAVTVGRFRQLFGVVNRWHEHDLDQAGYPLALTAILGEDGLVQTGLSAKWLMPSLVAHANELTVEITDGSNQTLFAGEHFSVPAFLVHLKNYYDLNESTYLELGLTGMYGWNNRRGVPDSDAGDGRLVDEERRSTWLGGVDLTLFWQPLQRAKYRSFTWRSEALWAVREEPALTKGRWGVYSYLQYQPSERWFVGLRGDVVTPIARREREIVWQVTPYVTFWQSEFVYLRLEARHGDGFDHGRDTRFLLQVDWAAGPHKHEKY